MERADSDRADTGTARTDHTGDTTHAVPPTRDSDTANTCRLHTHGDTCGVCGFGLRPFGTFESTEFAGYCD